MYFPFFILHGWRKRFAIQPQTIYSEFPLLPTISLALSRLSSVSGTKQRCIHTVKATPANVHDVTQTSSLLTGEEDVVYGDSGYLGAGNREDAIVRNKSGRKIKYKINRRPSQ